MSKANHDERDRDRELVAATLAGNRQAFGQLVRHYQRRVMGLAYRYVGNQADAADLTQRAFLKAFEKLGSLAKTGSFAAWLMQITANLARNQIRFYSTKQFEAVEETTLRTEARSDELLSRRRQRKAMRAALAELPEKQRLCVTLRIDAELPFREIGEAVGCSEASARVNFHHGLKRLRSMLAEDGAGRTP